MFEPTTYAKIEDGVVIDVRVVEWDFLIANPERYGDSDSWIQVFRDNSGRGYCSKGWLYDAETDTFTPPQSELNE